MTLGEYIKDYYDVTDKIRNRVKDPIQMILDSDALPCDEVKMVDGELHKIAYIDDDDQDYVTVLSLMSLQEKEVEELNHPGLTRVWKSYAACIDTSSLEMQELLAQAKLFTARKEQKKGAVYHLLHHSEH